jgi:hypothetical protein
MHTFYGSVKFDLFLCRFSGVKKAFVILTDIAYQCCGGAPFLWSSDNGSGKKNGSVLRLLLNMYCKKS